MNLRGVISGVSFSSAIWSLITGIGYFKGIDTDENEGVSKLTAFAIVMGIIYLAMCLIAATGVLAAATQHLSLVRTFAILSLAQIGLTVGGGIIEIIVHFTSKSDILNECTTFAEGTTTVTYPFGVIGPSQHNATDAADAVNWCNHEYDQSSWQDIIVLIVRSVLSCVVSAIAWRYYRQLLSESASVGNSFLAPLSEAHPTAYPPRYTPPYNASVPDPGYSYREPYGVPEGAQMYAPPPGAPPPREDARTRLAYGVDDKNPFNERL
ncbi:hypothetical protein B0H11DRAFT_2237237 [Mycena galericulata]|nr:hypothetical protein B0H11DRAFT_2237237 [Mycena galericulata]